MLRRSVKIVTQKLRVDVLLKQPSFTNNIYVFYLTFLRKPL